MLVWLASRPIPNVRALQRSKRKRVDYPEPGGRGLAAARVRRQPEVIVSWFAELATSMS
jgi:hypothetical protein